jgi:tetratricopeptide (TPR) repeat protein
VSDTGHNPGSILAALATPLEESVLTGEGLPHGPPPPALVELDSHEEPPWQIVERVRGLVANGQHASDGSPKDAAIYWHEAGRLLDRRARRPSEAWICHSQAVAISGDHKPAYDALRRLARRAADQELLASVLASQIDRASDRAETAALLSEKASLELQSDRAAAAIDSLRDATAAAPGALIPKLLKLTAATRERADEELAESLSALADHWPTPAAAAEAGLIQALVEERLGRADTALDRLREIDADGGEAKPIPSTLWARARLSWRSASPAEAMTALEALAEPDTTAEAADAFHRLRTAMAVLAMDSDSAITADDTARADLTWDLRLLDSLRRTDRIAEADATAEAARSCRTPGLAAAALGASILARAQDPEAEAPTVPEEVDAAGPYAGALKAFLKLDQQRTSWAPGFDREADPVAVLHHALTHDEAQEAVGALAAMREKALDIDERWGIAVAEAVLHRDRLDSPESALDVLRSTTDRLDRAPLPSLIRLHDRSDSGLAELAQAEAFAAEDRQTEAWLLSWAGHHMRNVDPDQSAELHRRALDINPTCGLSLAALERHTTDHETLAQSFAAAATASASSEERGRNLVRAGVHHLAAGRLRQALEQFGEALELMPGDRDLWRSVIRLASSYPSFARREFLDSPPFTDEIAHSELLALGVLGLAVDPVAATRWFEKALEAEPDDPVGQIGLTEALLAADRWSVVSGRLLDALREAETPRDEALIYARMADIDARYGDDPSSALLSLMSLEERLPGHRPTLARLAFYFARQGRTDELVNVLASLATTLVDDTDAAAMANAAWQTSKLDLATLRLAVAREPDSLLALTELEARTSDPAERGELLARIVGQQEGSALFLSRLADAVEASGDLEQARDLRNRALLVNPSSLHDLHGLERAHRGLGDHAGLVETLLKHVAATQVDELKIESLLQAAQVVHESLGDSSRAAAICLELMQVDPKNDEAYTNGRLLLEDTGDLQTLDKLIGLRIAGTDEPAAKHPLILELADLRLRSGERQGAKIALSLALDLAPNDLPTRRRLAFLHREDGEWQDAIDQLMEAARLAREPEAGIEIFFALGELYMDHSDKKDLAEKSFVKVLGWDRSHFAAMERLADLYAELGNWTRSAQALERLMVQATDPAVKVAKMVTLAGVLETRLNRAKDAENILNEARRVDPSDVAPVEALAGMYARQKDSMALNVLLDQALASQSLAAAGQPGNADIYGNMMILLTMKAADSLASLAAAAIRMLGGTPPVRKDMDNNPPEAHWDLGGRVGDPALEDYLSPKEAPAGLRGTLRFVEEPVARMLGGTAKQIGMSRDARLDRKHPLNQTLGRLASSFGLKQEPVFYKGAGDELRIAPGSPAAVILPPSAVAARDDDALVFVAAMSLVLVRSGLALATLMPEDRLRRVVAGLVKLCVPSATPPPDIAPEDLEREISELKQVVPANALGQIQPLAFDCNTALEHSDLKQNLLTVGHRTGFLAAGSLTAAIEGLRVISGQKSAGLGQLSGVGRLVSFVFSKDHLELRQRLGL